MSNFIPKQHRFSNSMKRATIKSTRPGIGQTIVQEDAGKVDQKLRDAIDAIEAAHKAFSEIWYDSEVAEGKRVVE